MPLNQLAPSAADAAVVPSTCWECGAICGSLLTVRDGKVLKIAPNPAHPSSRGAFCVKGIRAAHEWTYQDCPAAAAAPHRVGAARQWPVCADQLG